MMRHPPYDPFGIERGPETGVETDIVETFVEGYHALGRVEPQTFDTVTDDLISRVEAGQLTQEEAAEVLVRLGFSNT